MSNLADYPFTGTLTSIPRMRRIAINPYPYFIFYLADEEEIIVVGIRHAARDPRSMPDNSSLA